jgi:hypothetical protein
MPLAFMPGHVMICRSIVPSELYPVHEHILALEEQVLIKFVLIRFWQCIPTADLEDGSPTIAPLVD